jgi:transposase Tn5 family protein
LEPEEWQAVYTVVTGAAPPAVAPPLGEMVKLIATLGGYLGRKGDGPPGPKALWVGMQRMTDLALGWHAFASIKPPPTG